MSQYNEEFEAWVEAQEREQDEVQKSWEIMNTEALTNGPGTVFFGEGGIIAYIDDNGVRQEGTPEWVVVTAPEPVTPVTAPRKAYRAPRTQRSRRGGATSSFFREIPPCNTCGKSHPGKCRACPVCKRMHRGRCKYCQGEFHTGKCTGDCVAC